MPGAPGTHVTITPNTSKVFSAGGRVRYDLSQLASLQGPPPRKSYVRSFNLNVDLLLTNGNAGGQTINWQQLYTIITSVFLQMQGHQFINLPFSGGASIRALNFVMFGKKPQVSTDAVYAATGAGGLVSTGYGPTLKFIIPCYDPVAISSEEDVLPVGILTGTYLDVVWCAAAQFGANFTISTASTQIRSATAEIIQRDEVRWPALWCWEERNQSGTSDFITPEGVLYTHNLMVVAPSTGQTWAGFVAANLTALVFTNQNGMKAVDSLSPADVIALYNSQQGMSSEGYIADYESGNADIIPLQYLPRSSEKKTHIQPDLSKPYLQLTGSIAVTAFRMLLHYYKPTGPRTVADLAAKANQPLPAGFAANPRKFLMAKGALKQPVSAAKSSFIAQKLSV